MLVLAALDLALYIWVGTAVLTVMAHAMSLWLVLRHRLIFDLVKLLETSALFIDLYLIKQYGYAVASPVSTLFAILQLHHPVNVPATRGAKTNPMLPKSPLTPRAVPVLEVLETNQEIPTGW